MKMMASDDEPITISGPRASGPDAIPTDRRVLWKRVCQITDVSTPIAGTSERPEYERRECIIEMSRNKTRFWIVAVDLRTGKYSTLELFRVQADKILRAIDNSLSMLMKYLEFRFGTLCIKDQELLLSYQLYQAE